MLSTGPAGAAAALLLAHGAGAGMSSPFLERFSDLLGERGIAVHRFEFGYMAGRTLGAPRRPPPRAETLNGEMEVAVQAVRKRLQPGQLLFIGGKSMGGRIATMVADRLFSGSRIAGVVALGYPFHPPGKPAQLRTAHLVALSCPLLIVQGERDPFGTRSEVEGYALSPAIEVYWSAAGNHDLVPERGSGRSGRQALAEAADAVANFIGTRAGKGRVRVAKPSGASPWQRAPARRR